MIDNKELKDEELKGVAGGLDHATLDDCEAAIAATKDLINAYDTVLTGDNNYLNLKNMFLTIVDKYEHSYYKEAYDKTIELKNFIPIFRNRGDESFSKFVGELENNVLAIDFLLRQLCTN